MKRLMVLALLLLAGFYVAWPAWSGYQIREALQARDAAKLDAKVDFDSVRVSLRPIVTQKVSDGFDRYQGQAGPTAGLILGQLKKDVIPRIVETSLVTLLTPETIIRIASEAGPIKESFERIMREQMGRSIPGGAVNAGGDTSQAAGGGQSGLGGMLGRVLNNRAATGNQPGAVEPKVGEPKPGEVEQPPQPTKRTYSYANIKSFAFNGPLSFRVGVAKDPATPDADVTAEMSFTGGDWKVTGLVPRP